MDAKAIATELDTAARRRAYRSLTAPVTVGSRLDFELRMPGLAIDEPVTSLVWRARTGIESTCTRDSTEAVQFGERLATMTEFLMRSGSSISACSSFRAGEDVSLQLLDVSLQLLDEW